MASTITQAAISPGYVYVIGSIELLWFKIGKTVNPGQRLPKVREAVPFHCNYEILYRSEDMGKAERELHRMFAEAKTKGEWFRLTPQQFKTLHNDPVLTDPLTVHARCACPECAHA